MQGLIGVPELASHDEMSFVERMFAR